MGLFNFWKNKTKQAVIEGALEGIEALENLDSQTSEDAAQTALSSLSEKVRVVGGQPIVQVNIVNVGGTVAMPGATVDTPALPAAKVTVVEATEPVEEPTKEGGKKKAAKK